MAKTSEILLKEYQVRKSKNQKRAFIDWLTAHLKTFDYSLKEDKYSNNGINLVVGDIEKAKVILTAHYDTQPNFFFPVVMGFSNWFTFILSQLWMMVPFVIIYFITGGVQREGDFLNFNIFLPMLIIIYCLQMTIGIANKHTANDNTSGVATILAILEELAKEERDKVCFVFFDQEELGLLGSDNFKKKHKNILRDKPLINFDCVGDGDTLFFVTKKKFRKSKFNHLLENSVANKVTKSDKAYRFGTAIKHIYTSDQIIFKNSVGVTAAKKSPVFGYYLNRVHTRWDTKLDIRNIELLKDSMIDFISSIT